MSKTAAFVTTIAITALLLGSTSALADDAKDAYDGALAAFKEGNYSEAADLFREANVLKPSWKLLYNIGQSEAAAKRHGLALEAFETYLAKGGDDVPDARREEVLSEVERLRKIVGKVEIKAPQGSEIFIDGVSRGTAPLLGKIPVSAGVKHAAWAVSDGEKLPEREFKVMGSDSISLDLSAEEEGPKEPELTEPTPVAPTQPVEEPGSGLKVGGWVMVGVGGAMLVAGAVTGAMAKSLDDELYKDCTDNHCPSDRQDDIDKLGTLSAVTDVMLFGGGAIAATGVILLIVDARKNKESDEEGPVSVAPSFGPGFTGATIQGRF